MADAVGTTAYARPDGRSEREGPRVGRPGGSAAPGRTLWHTLYYPEERKVEIDVYLGESHAGGRQSIERSGWVSVTLGDE